MSGGESHPELRDLPEPRVTKMRWPFPWIWLVTIGALAVAGGYVYLQHQQQGVRITIQFDDAEGLRAGQTPLTLRGAQIGTVSGVELTPDRRHVLVQVAIEQKYASIASEGALFWIVKPSFSDGTVSGLTTVVSGPYIQAEPGVGKPQTNFVGLPKEPPSLGDGLILILHAERLEHLQPDSPIYYRGIQVGVVEDAHFAPDATHIDINAVIREPFAKLVTTRSQFWRISGADVKGGIFSGISVKLDSLRTLLTGGIEFATPEDGANLYVKDGAQFILHEDFKKEWLTWAPKIQLPPAAISQPEAQTRSSESSRLNSALNQKQGD